MKAFGASPEQIKEFREKIRKSQILEVLECNMEAVEIFRASKLESKIAPSGHVLYDGISGVELKEVAEMLGYQKPNRQTFIKIRILENKAIQILSRR